MLKERFIGIVLGIFGISATITNLFSLISSGNDLINVITYPIVSVVFCFTILIFLSSFLKKKIAVIIQVLLLIIAGTTYIFYLPASLYGNGFLLLAFLYIWTELNGERARLYHLLGAVIYNIAIIVISASKKYPGNPFAVIDIILFIFMFTLIIMKLLGKTVDYLIFSGGEILDYQYLNEKYDITNAEYKVIALLIDKATIFSVKLEKS